MKKPRLIDMNIYNKLKNKKYIDKNYVINKNNLIVIVILLIGVIFMYYKYYNKKNNKYNN